MAVSSAVAELITGIVDVVEAVDVYGGTVSVFDGSEGARDVVFGDAAGGVHGRGEREDGGGCY